jgi:hypothetical protein
MIEKMMLVRKMSGLSGMKLLEYMNIIIPKHDHLA